MSVGININVSALVKLQRKIKSIRLAELKPVEKPILAAVQAQIRENFDKQQAGDGQAWQRLAPATQRDRQRKGFNPTSPILVRTGALRAAVVDKLKVKTDGPVMSFNFGGDRRLNRIAQYHSSGTGKIPPRPFAVVTVKLSETITRIVSDQQAKQLKEALAAD